MEQVNACMAKYHMGNFRADVSFQWMDNAVINGRTSFVRIFIFRQLVSHFSTMSNFSVSVYITSALWHEPSVCLSVVCNVIAPIDSVEVLGNIFVSCNNGSGRTNDNSTRLLSLCATHSLSVLGSWFKRKDIY